MLGGLLQPAAGKTEGGGCYSQASRGGWARLCCVYLGSRGVWWWQGRGEGGG